MRATVTSFLGKEVGRKVVLSALGCRTDNYVRNPLKGVSALGCRTDNYGRNPLKGVSALGCRTDNYGH